MWGCDIPFLSKDPCFKVSWSDAKDGLGYCTREWIYLGCEVATSGRGGWRLWFYGGFKLAGKRNTRFYCGYFLGWSTQSRGFYKRIRCLVTKFLEVARKLLAGKEWKRKEKKRKWAIACVNEPNLPHKRPPKEGM